MPRYRVYFVDRAGYIAAPAEVIICLNDEDARQKARLLIDTRDVELWQGARLVELFAHK